jgi:hypothetical protein
MVSNSFWILRGWVYEKYLALCLAYAKYSANRSYLPLAQCLQRERDQDCPLKPHVQGELNSKWQVA